MNSAGKSFLCYGGNCCVQQWDLLYWVLKLTAGWDKGKGSDLGSMEDISQQVDGCIVAWMECVTVNIIWKILHSIWTVVLQLEWSVLHWTLYGRYFTASGQLYCSLNAVCYSEHYLEDTSQQVDSDIAAWMKFVTVNIIWKILYSRWTVVLELECSALQWTLSERYFAACGQWYCSLNEVCYSEHYLKDTSQQVDSGIAAWMMCVTVNII